MVSRRWQLEAFSESIFNMMAAEQGTREPSELRIPLRRSLRNPVDGDRGRVQYHSEPAQEYLGR